MLGGDGVMRVTPARNRLFSPFGCCFCLSMFMAVLGLISLAGLIVAAVSLNKPAVVANANTLLNSTEVTDCQDEVNLGDKSCLKDFYSVKRWRSLQWYILYLLPCIAPIALGFMIWWMYYNDSRLLFWIMTIAWFILVAWAWTTLGFDIWYIIDCKSYSFCANFEWTFAPIVGVKYKGPDWAFILHLSCVGGVALFNSFFWVLSLFAQYYAATGKLALTFAQALRPASASTDAPKHMRFGKYRTKNDPNANAWFRVPQSRSSA